ncbi:MAG: hypothetical protein ACFKPT_26375 [Gloeotrichia echinulata GP01]
MTHRIIIRLIWLKTRFTLGIGDWGLGIGGTMCAPTPEKCAKKISDTLNAGAIPAFAHYCERRFLRT